MGLRVLSHDATVWKVVYVIDPDADRCPECGVSWQGQRIDTDYVVQGLYGHNAPCQRKQSWDKDFDDLVPCTCGPRYYHRLIGIELSPDHPDHYDGVSCWQCPDCNTRWDRFTGKLVSTSGVGKE